jgi:hypothetical protein
MSSSAALKICNGIYFVGFTMTSFYLLEANTYYAGRYIQHKSRSSNTLLDKCILYPTAAIKSLLYGVTWPISLFIVDGKGLKCPLYNYGLDTKYKQFYDQIYD